MSEQIENTQGTENETPEQNPGGGVLAMVAAVAVVVIICGISAAIYLL